MAWQWQEGYCEYSFVVTKDADTITLELWPSGAPKGRRYRLEVNSNPSCGEMADLGAQIARVDCRSRQKDAAHCTEQADMVRIGIQKACAE